MASIGAELLRGSIHPPMLWQSAEMFGVVGLHLQVALAMVGSGRMTRLVASVGFMEARLEERGERGRPLANEEQAASCQQDNEGVDALLHAHTVPLAHTPVGWLRTTLANR